MNIKKFLKKKITRTRMENFLEKHKTNEHTLEIGCGRSPYKKWFPNRVGMDIIERPGVDIVGDAHELPFKDGEFDVVLANEVLEHLQNPQKAIDEMYRVLRKGGKLILTTRFIFPIHGSHCDYFRHTKYGLKYLLRNWRLLEVREEENFLETIGVLFQQLVFQTSLRGGALLRYFF